MSKFVQGLIVGAAAGAAIALLYAPRPGAETRAMLADRAGEYWGHGQDFYDQHVKDLGTKAAEFVPVASAKSDELREKIEIARERIATKVAENAANARSAVDVVVPVAAGVAASATEKAAAAVDATAAVLGKAAGVDEEPEIEVEIEAAEDPIA